MINNKIPVFVPKSRIKVTQNTVAWIKPRQRYFLISASSGAIASQKTEYRFKIGTIRNKKPEDWIIVEGRTNRRQAKRVLPSCRKRHRRNSQN